jgi:hypothetical protein
MERMFLKGFAGRNRPCHLLDEKHSLGKPYMSEHGRHVLRTLEHTGKINKEPSAERRPRSKGGMTMRERPPQCGASRLARKKMPRGVDRAAARSTTSRKEGTPCNTC